MVTIKGLGAGVAQAGSHSKQSRRQHPLRTRHPEPEETAIPAPTLLLAVYAAIDYRHLQHRRTSMIEYEIGVISVR
nr:hypothetical protein [Aeromonas bestiarum]